jgi:uncharacterized protein YdaT
MPWTAQSFAKHNKGLSPSQKIKAAQIANDILEKGGSEARAIKIANSVVARRLTKGKK